MSLIRPAGADPLSVRVARGASAVLGARTSRRGFLARSAVVGSALAVSPWDFALKPGTAYAAVCGPSSTCSSGYSAFCCTINGGINKCPPGNFVGGWWKADGSGFCCGKPRYYVDCHEKCTQCTSGCGSGSFCKGCHECSCRCSGSSGCDGRKTCCNYFRYGQCEQQIDCSGPVTCRLVSCTPPWQQYDSCSTASATDNNTLNHSSDCLPGQCPSAIEKHYFDFGGPYSFLGKPAAAETETRGGEGRVRRYEGGHIFWRSSLGAHEVHGAIEDRYGDLSYERGLLGFPTTDQSPTRDGVGRFNHFERGSIFSTSATGAHSVIGVIRECWRTLGFERSRLGYPTSEQNTLATGVKTQNFQNGRIYYSANTGAHDVRGDILARYLSFGGSTSRLGLPTSNQTLLTGGGAVTRFQNGAIFDSNDTRASAVEGEIGRRYRTEGENRSRLGFPTSDEFDVSGGRASNFQNGRITWTRATGATRVTYS